MDIILFHSVWTVLLLVLFIGIWAWLEQEAQGRVDAAARLPLDEDLNLPTIAGEKPWLIHKQILGVVIFILVGLSFAFCFALIIWMSRAANPAPRLSPWTCVGRRPRRAQQPLPRWWLYMFYITLFFVSPIC